MSTQQKQPPKGRSYAGPSGGLKKDAFWLASEDLGSREVVAVIEDVLLYDDVAFEKGRKESGVPALKFVGKEKQMILNATNRKAVARLYGLETKDWRGKSVTIYVDGNVNFGGKTVSGLRIKSEVPGKANPSLSSMLGGEEGAQ